MIPRNFLRCSVLVFVIFLVGCGQSNPAQGESLAPENVQTEATLAPGEVIHISGEGDSVSVPFKLDGPGAVQVYWRQESTKFIVELANANEQLAEGPMGRITFALETEPSEFVEDTPYNPPFEYLPGDYVLEITSDGIWEVWVKVFYP